MENRPRCGAPAMAAAAPPYAAIIQDNSAHLQAHYAGLMMWRESIDRQLATLESDARAAGVALVKPGSPYAGPPSGGLAGAPSAASTPAPSRMAPQAPDLGLPGAPLPTEPEPAPVAPPSPPPPAP